MMRCPAASGPMGRAVRLRWLPDQDRNGMFNIFKAFSQRQFTREAEKLRPIVTQVNALEPEMMALSDQELAGLTVEFRQRLGVQPDRDKNGPEQSTVLDELLPEAFAAVREAARRTIGLRPY